MKTRHHPKSVTGARAAQAFTLVETLVMSGMFMLMIAAIFGAHLYGLKMSTRIGIKLGASDDARQAISTMMQDIRGAGAVYVGTGDANGFINAAANSPQQGDCLQIYPANTTNALATNQWVRYYYLVAPAVAGTGTDNRLMRTTDVGNNDPVTANYVTNDPPIFKKVDYTGTVTTSSNQQPYAVEVTLSFTRLANPQVPIGGTNYFSSYQVLTRISPRNQ